jgi:hypothetical protein
MAFTYDLTTTIGKVRFLVGDNDPDNILMQDDEIQFCYDQSFESLLLAAAMACEAMASKVSANLTDIVLGSLRINETTKSEQLMAMADRFREKENSQPAFAAVETDNCSFSELTIIKNWIQRTQLDDGGF